MTSKPNAMHEFVRTLPLPDHIGSAEYRAIYDLLEEADGDGLDDVDAILWEFEQWARDIRRRLDRVAP